MSFLDRFYKEVTVLNIGQYGGPPVNELAAREERLRNGFPRLASGYDGGITANQAMGIGTVQACVRNISDDIGTLPVRLLCRKPDDSRSKVSSAEHPVSGVLSSSPNPDMTPADMMACLQAHVELRGNAYALLTRRTFDDRVIAWDPVSPDSIEVRRDGNNVLEYVPQYVDRNGHNKKPLPASQIFHLRGLGWDGIKGYSVISYQARMLNTGRRAAEYGEKFFQNGAMPGKFVLETDREFAPEDEKIVLADWNAMHGGAENAHRTALLHSGLKAKALNISIADTQLLQLMQATDISICGMFRMPPHMVGLLERATNNNIEQQSLEYVIYCLRPRIVRLEQAIKRCLLGADANEMYVKFNVDALLRGDFESRQRGYATALQNGYFTTNDVLELEDRNGIGPEGDVYRIQQNMGPLEALSSLFGKTDKNGQPPPPQP